MGKVLCHGLYGRFHPDMTHEAIHGINNPMGHPIEKLMVHSMGYTWFSVPNGVPRGLCHGVASGLECIMAFHEASHGRIFVRRCRLHHGMTHEANPRDKHSHGASHGASPRCSMVYPMEYTMV